MGSAFAKIEHRIARREGLVRQTPRPPWGLSPHWLEVGATLSTSRCRERGKETRNGGAMNEVWHFGSLRGMVFDIWYLYFALLDSCPKILDKSTLLAGQTTN